MFQKEFKSFIQNFMSHYQSLCIFPTKLCSFKKPAWWEWGGRKKSEREGSSRGLISEKYGSDNHLRQRS